MGKVNKKKFYRPGTLEVKGTKISLKTQPYTNGVIFDINDPIGSFRIYLSKLKYLINQYEYVCTMPGSEMLFTEESIGSKLSPEEIGRLKLLLNYLVESPTEILLKEQVVDEQLLNDLEVRHE